MHDTVIFDPAAKPNVQAILEAWNSMVCGAVLAYQQDPRFGQLREGAGSVLPSSLVGSAEGPSFYRGFAEGSLDSSVSEPPAAISHVAEQALASLDLLDKMEHFEP